MYAVFRLQKHAQAAENKVMYKSSSDFCNPRAGKSLPESSSLVQESVEFGYTRKDVILIGAGLIGAGYALYYGAQAFGVEATTAGNYVQLFIFLVICVGYISTYIFRVANKVRAVRV